MALKIWFIYVLRCENKCWYVGATSNLNQRLKTHFRGGGATATQQSRAVSIEKVYQLEDYLIGAESARERAEVIVANTYAEQYGYDKVRGAKHGEGWADGPSENQLRTIKRCQRFAQSEAGRQLIAALLPYDFSELKFEKSNKQSAPLGG